MYWIATIFSILYTNIECANYQRYGETTGRYPSSTISNLNTQFPFRSVNYANDIANFPEVTRYPNYSPGYSSSPGYNNYSPGYNNYSPGNNNYSPGYNNYSPGYNNYSPGYSTSRYPYNNNGYSTTGYNTLYSGGSSNVNYNQGFNQRYGEVYGQRPGMQGGYSAFEEPFVRNIGECKNRTPQTQIWVESLMGMWYGVELIQHLGADSRVDYARTCIVIHIAEPRDRPSTEHQFYHVQHINAKFHQDYRHLRLLWDEAGHTIEYALYFRNDSAGYWHVYDGQNGTLTTRANYQQFSGTVQVLKAVNDHLVLNFCQEGGLSGRPSQQYSVLFSRNPGQLNQWEIDAVHNLLQTKQLSTASRRMVCGNSAVKPLYSIVVSILTCILAYIVGSS